ncbi:MAG: PHP domain-containing protein [Candidatus Gastranaerophilaceae bacterium]|jgi:hypothetical protein
MQEQRRGAGDIALTLDKRDKMKYIYPGVIHIHTTYSDGTSDIKKIAKIARKFGLSWIIITDHNSLEGLHNNEEGFYDGVAVIIGNEVSPADSDHFLAFDVKKETDIKLAPQEVIYDVKKQGGFGFVAHPDESLSRKNPYPALRWTDWNMNDVEGLEIWNFASDWVDLYIPKYGLLQGLLRHRLLKGPTKNTLKWWDDLNNKNSIIIPGIGGVDAHSLKIRRGPLCLSFADYADTFQTITNMAFLENKITNNFDEAKKQILNAVKSGNNIIVNRYWNNKNDYPLFYAEDTEKRVYPGETINLTKYTKLMAKISKKATIRLINDGQLIIEQFSDHLEFSKPDIGKYRLEVYYKNKPWIFTNPINICNED